MGSKVYGGEMTIKLNLLFIAMDFLTLLAYPIVFMHGMMRRILKPQGITASTKKLAVASVMRAFDSL